jgi:hypothetical protein
MKTKLLAAIMLISTSFAPISIMAPAHADPVLPGDELARCNGNYVWNQVDPTSWRATVFGEYRVDGPSTQVLGSERNVNYRPDTGSTFIYSGLRAADPLTRTGGSVNMWGQTAFSQKTWDNTLYDSEARFEHTVIVYWSCHIEEYVATTSEWTFRFDGNYFMQGSEDNVDEGYSSIATDQQQAGHVQGVNYTETGTFSPNGVRTLACVNPGKKGGTWTRMNNYTGASCVTTYFNTAQTAYGYTFDTVGGTLPSTSLPQ